MKRLRFCAASLVLTISAFTFTASYGQDPNWKPPGTEEAEAVEQANQQLDAVYQRLMSKLDEAGQNSLREAERSWIKWRDNEAVLIARLGGAIGGSALRVDTLLAQHKLIRQRTEILKGYVTLADSN